MRVIHCDLTHAAHAVGSGGGGGGDTTIRDRRHRLRVALVGNGNLEGLSDKTGMMRDSRGHTNRLAACDLPLSFYNISSSLLLAVVRDVRRRARDPGSIDEQLSPAGFDATPPSSVTASSVWYEA